MKYSSPPCNRRKRNFFLFIHIAAFCIYMTLILVLAILRVTLEEKYIVINSLQKQIQQYKEIPTTPLSHKYREWWDEYGLKDDHR